MAPDEDVVDGDIVKKRKRGPQACSTCRQRKVKCDGSHPCSNCRLSDIECVYGTDPVTYVALSPDRIFNQQHSWTFLTFSDSKAKSDVILETVLRLEDQLARIGAQLSSNSGRSTSLLERDNTALSVQSPQTVGTDKQASSFTGAQKIFQNPRHARNASLDNAVLSAEHLSNTEAVLAWPYFDVFHNLRARFQPIFNIEQHRPSLRCETNDRLPDMQPAEVSEAVSAFQDIVNFVYPTSTVTQLEDVEYRILQGRLEASVECCFSLLVMALGCASQVVDALSMNDTSSTARESRSHRWRKWAQAYFSLYLQRSNVIHAEVTTTATQCLFFTALFYAYLHRPLQAWSYINMAAAKCRVLLSYMSADMGTDTECLRRIFWSCFILENDYIAELAALPQTGVSDMESSVPYPASFQTCSNDAERQRSSLYFLACISMRRLLNRVHDLLYGSAESGVAFDDARFPHVVRELDHQLEEWRMCLPPDFYFSIDTQPAVSQQGGFLRQRYLTCRAVIYRPYLNQVLSKTSNRESVSAQMVEKSEICLEMCSLHIMNLRAFCQTVLCDTWICSLSMASTMLLILAASMVPELKPFLGTRALGMGSHLSALLEPWMYIHCDDVSPSVKQSVWLVKEVTSIVEQMQREAVRRDQR